MNPSVLSAAAAVAQGRVVAFPTETYYGLAVDALDEAALARLSALKGRGADKAFPLLVADRAMLALLCGQVSPRAEELMARFWPGPLTLVLPARPGLPQAVVQEGGVAARISSNPWAQGLVRAAGRPITATSANPAGAAPPTTAAAVRAAFPDCLILDGGDTPGGPPSTLARVLGNSAEILRPGPISIG